MGSVLEDTKKLIGYSPDSTDFDTDIIIEINAVLAMLYQIGVPLKINSIEDNTSKWDDLVENELVANLISSYVPLKVKIVFDASSIGSSAMQSYTERIDELESRISYFVDAADTFE